MLRPTRDQPSARPLVVLILLALMLTIWQHRARSGQGSGAARRSLPERAAVAVVWPLQKAFSLVGSGAGRSVAALGRSQELAARCSKLDRENEELRAQQLRLIDAVIENQRLRKVLGFGGGAPPETLAARVVAVNSSLGRKRITVAGPPGRELEVGNIVRTAAGLVGRIIEARGNRGEVFLVTDAEHAVSAWVQRSRDQGMVHVATQLASRPDLLVLDKLIGRADIREGDVVLTSGLGEVYPPGIPIGDVVAVERSAAGTVDLRALIRPRVDFDHLEWVLVERHGK